MTIVAFDPLAIVEAAHATDTAGLDALTIQASGTGVFLAPNLLAPNLLAPNLLAPNLLAPNLLAPNLLAPNLLAP
jgi:hypothetical protein